MRRFLVTAVFAFVILAMLAPPGFAQAPAPKVTITGLFDQITSMGRNTYDGNMTRSSDREWYARTRFRPDFEFAVGRVKAVLGLEIDLQYGQSGPNDGGFPGNTSGSSGGQAAGAGGSTPPGCKVNTNGCLDLNTDVAGVIEIKWIYTEFPLTGKDSLLPFIPVESMARVGGQPFDTLAQYKLAQYANGDFAGISAITTFAPNIKTNLAWVMVEEELAGGTRGLGAAKTTRGEDYALIFSPEFTPFKGLDIKPLYSWFHADGQTSGTARRNLANIRTVSGLINGAGARGPATPGDPTNHEDRHTVGLDARLRMGPFGLDPTVYYQFGRADTQGFDNTGTARRIEGDIHAWLVDIIASYQLGPLLLEARGMYSTGNKARDNLSKNINYYQPLDTDGNYWAGGWTQFWASAVDYFNQGWTTTGNYVGYDRYGRVGFAGRATYSITPALSLYGVVHALFTAQAVDTDTTSQLASAAGAGTAARLNLANAPGQFQGDSSYVGTEGNLGMTWRFAPNTAFDLVGGYLFAGDALNATEVTPGGFVRKEAKDAYTLVGRIRLSF
jgi:hypothetical protein